MAKTGRKRKSVEREPNGQPIRKTAEKREDIMAPVLNYRRSMGVPESELSNQMAECVVGRYVLAGRLEEYHYDAAKAYEKVWRAYRVALDAPRGDVANDIAGVHGRPVLDEAVVAERDRAAIDAGQQVVQVLVGADLQYGLGAGEILVQAVLYGNAPHERGMILLRGALDELAVHFGTKPDSMTNKKS